MRNWNTAAEVISYASIAHRKQAKESKKIIFSNVQNPLDLQNFVAGESREYRVSSFPVSAKGKKKKKSTFTRRKWILTLRAIGPHPLLTPKELHTHTGTLCLTPQRAPSQNTNPGKHGKGKHIHLHNSKETPHPLLLPSTTTIQDNQRLIGVREDKHCERE